MTHNCTTALKYDPAFASGIPKLGGGAHESTPLLGRDPANGWVCASEEAADATLDFRKVFAILAPANMCVSGIGIGSGTEQ